MIATDDLTLGSFRLLEVDNRVALPINTHIRLLITSADVLHSWHSFFGIKVDATLEDCHKQLYSLNVKEFIYGQCSEICGVNHGFMPIVVKGLSADNFVNLVCCKIR
jgi:heme/copper-type cytochrome/quinol oxidase subunit 2